MKTIIKQFISITCLSASLTFSAQAALTEQDIYVYNQASAGDKTQVDPSYDIFHKLIETEGATALTLVYLGSTQTLQGRDAWMPWTQMKYVEKGLATIDKGLTLLASEATPLAQQPIYTGLKESYLARALAASTYSQLPDMFNHFERGYDLFLNLLAEPEFSRQPFAASAWVYHYAIQAAIRAEDITQAAQWSQMMQQQDKNHPLSIDAQQLLAKEAS